MEKPQNSGALAHAGKWWWQVSSTTTKNVHAVAADKNQQSQPAPVLSLIAVRWYTISTTININSSPKKEMVEQRERRRGAGGAAKGRNNSIIHLGAIVGRQKL